MALPSLASITTDGDVIILRKDGVTRCYIADVYRDGERPEEMKNRWQPQANRLEAEAQARERAELAGSRIWVWTGSGDLTPLPD